jgi:hypothetical protein
VTSEERQAGGYATRMAFALEKDPADAVRRTQVTLRIVAVTLGWLVLVPILVVYGLTGKHRDSDVFSLAALLNLLLPFAASVIATRNRRFGVGGLYIVLTLLMVIPAAALVHAG